MMHDQNQFPFTSLGPGGVTTLGPNGVVRSSSPPQEYYCVRIYLLPGDPNGNGGLDSNGFYVGFLEGMRWAAGLGTGAPPVRVHRIGDLPKLSGGDRVMAYNQSITTGAATATDNGLMLLVPVVEQGGGILLGQYHAADNSMAPSWGFGTIKNVRIYGGTLGSESSQSWTVPAENYVSLGVTDGSWVLIGSTADGWYLLDSQPQAKPYGALSFVGDSGGISTATADLAFAGGVTVSAMGKSITVPIDGDYRLWIWLSGSAETDNTITQSYVAELSAQLAINGTDIAQDKTACTMAELFLDGNAWFPFASCSSEVPLNLSAADVITTDIGLTGTLTNDCSFNGAFGVELLA